MSKTVLAELHSHSTFSDGVKDVRTLAHELHAASVAYWALTDHDTAAGCTQARVEAESLGIGFIDGIEISAFDRRSIHVLGLGVVPEKLQAFQDRRELERRERMRLMIQKIRDLGVEVDFARVEAAAGKGVLTRPHLARELVDQGAVPTIQAAFDAFLASGRPAYVEQTWPNVAQAVEIIHDAGGVAILAHPGIYDMDDGISRWVDDGIDGIEVGHPKHTPAQTRAYVRLADKHKILKTVSSDYHGPAISPVPLGKTEISQVWLDALLARLPQ